MTAHSRSVWRRLLLPDLAMGGALFTLFYALVFFQAPRKLFRDSDTGWHIRTGERILDSASLPRTDPYSWSKPDEPWYAWEWGADVVMGAAHRISGLPGVTLLYLVLLAACSWIWFRLHWACGGDFLIACAMASPMLSTVNMHWLARPHVFGWVLVLVWVLWIEKAREPFRRTGLAAAFAFGAIWANLHASFFLGPMIAVVYASGAQLKEWIWEREGTNARPRVSSLLALGLALLAGTFVNPYGWHLHVHVLNYLANRELLERIGEFQSFNFHSEGALQIVLTVVLAFTGAVVALMQRNPARFILLLVMGAMALRSARALPILALLAPLANGSITAALREANRVRFAKQIGAALTYSGNLRALDARLAGWALAPLALAALYAVLHSPASASGTGFPPDEFPVEASPAVSRLPAGARLLAPDKYGGYLIYSTNGGRKVYFDGRSDFYGVEFMKEYIRLVQARPGWEAILAKHHFTHALLPAGYTLATILPSRAWRELHRDQTAVLFEAPQ